MVEETGATGAAEAAVADTGAAASMGTAPEGSAVSGTAPDKSSYTKEEVSQIVQERLKAWQKFGKPEEIETRLTRAEQLERFHAQLSQQMGRSGIPGREAATPETEEDKKVRAYMERLYPGLTKYQEQQQAFAQQFQELSQRQWQIVTERSQSALKDMASKAGYKEDQFATLDQHVANSIRGNPQDLQEYMRTGNVDIVRKHFDAIDKWVRGFSAAPVATQAAQYAADKKKTAALPPRIPAGGVPAPTAQKKKLSNEERVSAAFEAFKKG